MSGCAFRNSSATRTAQPQRAKQSAWPGMERLAETDTLTLHCTGHMSLSSVCTRLSLLLYLAAATPEFVGEFFVLFVYHFSKIIIG